MTIDRIEPGGRLTGEVLRNAFRQARDGARLGPGLVGVQGVTVGSGRGQGRPPEFLPIKILGAVSIGGDQWLYEWAEAWYRIPNLGGWQLRVGGRSFSSPGYDLAHNLAETVPGGGVDLTTLPGTYALAPVPDDRIVIAMVVHARTGPQQGPGVVFDVPNPIVGECEEPPP